MTGLAFVTGASGQDGFFVTRKLRADGWRVEEFTRRELDLHNPAPFFDRIANDKPTEIYNLAGQSSVARSFAEPVETWATNADFVVQLLECLRTKSPETRLYQASSIEMFGGVAGASITHDERSPLHPLSPYAAAKSAAHLMCGRYREHFGLRVACGIVSNHESSKRGRHFLSRKIVDHVAKLRQEPGPPLRVGNLKIARDWGYAADYANGIIAVLRQCEIRGIEDRGENYRDYVLATGKTHTVWQLIDAAFRLAGFELRWHLDGDDPAQWHAAFADGRRAVECDPGFLRASEPLEIHVLPARARADLGWKPNDSVDAFLSEMLQPAGEPAWR